MNNAFQADLRHDICDGSARLRCEVFELCWRLPDGIITRALSFDVCWTFSGDLAAGLFLFYAVYGEVEYILQQEVL